jgi:hypothetical protein
MKLIDTYKKFIEAILMFNYKCNELEWINDGYSVVFSKDDEVKYARLQVVVGQDDSFVYNRETFSSDKTVFQCSANYIRIFKTDNVRPLLGKYKDSIVKRANGDMVCPYSVVRNVIVEIDINNLA